MPDPIANLDPETELRSVLASPDSSPTTTTSSQFELLPMSGEAAKTAQTNAQRAVSPVSAVETGYANPFFPDFAAKMGARAGIPFDTTSGLGFTERVHASLEPSPADEVKMLKRKYGPDNVRLNAFGMPIVTIKDEAGKARDVMAHPIGMDWENLADQSETLLALGGSLLALYATHGKTLGPGIANALKTLGLTTLGARGTLSAKDIGMRILEGEPMDLKEIAQRQAAGSVVDLGVGAGLGLAGKALGTVASPFSRFGPMEARARDAQAYIAAQHGVHLPLTPAEATGSPILQRTEAMEMQKPGSSTAFQQFFADRWKQLQELRDIIMGGPSPNEEAAGKRVLATAGSKLAPAEFEVQRAASETAKAATGEIESAIGPVVSKPTLGEATRTAANDIRTKLEAQTDKLYADVFNDPLTKTKNIAGGALAADADAMVAKLPSTAQTSTIVGPSGQPLPSTTLAPMEAFLQPGVLPKLRALQAARDQNFRLDELMQMRNRVRNEIKEGQAVFGLKDKQLGDIESLLTDRIKTGLNELSPDLLKRWETANTQYAKNAQRLEKSGISELFRSPNQPGFIGSTEAVTRATQGKSAPDIYSAYREFFGPNHPVMEGMRQSVRDDVLKRSELSPVIDAKGLVNRLEDLDRTSPGLLRDAFGLTAAKLRASAKALEAAGGDELPKEELERLMASGNLSAAKLTELASAQAKKANLWRNDLFRNIAKGNVDPERIQPTDVVNRLVFDKRTQPSQLRDFMVLIQDRPEVTEDIRRLAFKRVLDDATITAPSGTRVLSANDLEKALSDPNLSERLRSVLGGRTMTDLEAIKDFLKPGAVVQQSAKSAGGIAAGQQITGLVERGDLSYVGRAVKNFLLATIYTSPAARKYAANTVFSGQDKALLVNGLVAMTPVIEAMAKTYGKESAREIAIELARTAPPQPQAQTQAPGQAIPTTGLSPEAELRQVLTQP